jgi:DNA-binding XRE family transcriptional regulator
MNLQTIKSINGKIEYVLLPIDAYNTLRHQIKDALNNQVFDEDYEPFNPSDYINNPVATLRITACITQKELAKRMHVSQAYISKIENQTHISLKVIQKIKRALAYSA